MNKHIETESILTFALMPLVAILTEEFMRHQPKYQGEYDDIFAHAFDALTILSGTQHIVQLKETEQ